MMFHWLLQLDWRTNWMLVALLLEKVTSLICRQEIGFFFSCFFFDLFNLFTPKISFLILLTVCHTVLMMLLHNLLLIFFFILSTCLLAIVLIT